MTSPWSNVSGSAPYRSTLARSLASCCVKSPVISALPPGMASLTAGAETTIPSRTIANWLSGGCCVASWLVTSVNCWVPSPSNCSVTTHVVVPWRTPESASLILAPSTATGASRYFAVPSWSQVMSTAAGSWVPPPCRFSGRVQSRASNSAWSSGVTVADGGVVGPVVAGAVGSAAAVGIHCRRRRLGQERGRDRSAARCRRWRCCRRFSRCWGGGGGTRGGGGIRACFGSRRRDGHGRAGSNLQDRPERQLRGRRDELELLRVRWLPEQRRRYWGPASARQPL